jgi:acetate kinase
MVTRSGSVDPGALLHLLRHGVSIEELDAALEHESGLAGLSGTSGDVRELGSSPDAELAVDVFTYRVACAIAAMTVPLGGIDALVFTAGIGEGSEDIRARICRRLEHHGVTEDKVIVVHAREDVIAARDARAVTAVT